MAARTASIASWPSLPRRRTLVAHILQRLSTVCTVASACCAHHEFAEFLVLLGMGFGVADHALISVSDRPLDALMTMRCSGRSHVFAETFRMPFASMSNATSTAACRAVRRNVREVEAAERFVVRGAITFARST